MYVKVGNIERYENLKKRKIKIAIMTWYHYRNFGTALQASALNKVISDMGFETQIVQYRPVGNILQKMNLELFCRRTYNWILKRLFGPKEFNSEGREELFRRYLESRIVETDLIESEEDFEKLNDFFDAFVCGSDQIWSPLGYNDKYYLSFVKDDGKKIAYAPSMGVSEIADAEVKHRITELLKKFKHISVREKQGARIIKELTGQEAKVVLDPTFLLTASEWDEYTDVLSAQQLNQPYILCYYLGNPLRYRECVKDVAEKWGLPVYEIPTIRCYGRYAGFPFEVGPGEFVSLIKNASFIFTDSYHGMIFSIIYKIPFIVFERFKKDDPRNQNSRIYNLVQLLGLEKRLKHPADICGIGKIPQLDFSDCYGKLDKLRKESLEYLEQALEGAVSDK